MSDKEAPKQETRHKVGCTRTIQTAILVCEYLRTHCALASVIHGDCIKYVFDNPDSRNGFWSADIIAVTWGTTLEQDRLLTEMVRECRAFVAGRGEIW